MLESHLIGHILRSHKLDHQFASIHAVRLQVHLIVATIIQCLFSLVLSFTLGLLLINKIETLGLNLAVDEGTSESCTGGK
jgi:hypothetical protein